ncbi:MAG: DoxX family protein [Bacteroidota bacterium]
MKTNKIIYWIATGIVCFVFFTGGLMYFFNYDYAHSFFVNLGFPTWIIYPLGILKILGPVAILSRKSPFLKELAYAGFLYDAILAVTAHLMVGDGYIYHGIAAIILTIVSWIYDRKLFGKMIQVKPVTNK